MAHGTLRSLRSSHSLAPVGTLLEQELLTMALRLHTEHVHRHLISAKLLFLTSLRETHQAESIRQTTTEALKLREWTARLSPCLIFNMFLHF